MERKRGLAAVLLVGLVLLHLVVAFAFRSSAAPSTQHLVWTLTLGQCGLLAWWVGVTRLRRVWKLAGWCTGTALLLALLSRPSVTGPWSKIPWKDMHWHMYLPPPHGGGGGGEFPIIALMMVAFSLAASLVLRRRGIHLITPFADQDQSVAKAPLRRWQFGLRDLLLLMATASVTMGLLALIAPYPGWILELPVAWCKWLPFIHPPMRVVIALEHVGFTFLAALATLPRPFLSQRLGWVALVAAVWPLAMVWALVAAGLYAVGFDPDIIGIDLRKLFLGNLRLYYANSFREFGFLAASFLVVRLAGCRLVRGDSDRVQSSRGSEARQMESEAEPDE